LVEDKRFYCLDLLRALAVLLVFFYHLSLINNGLGLFKYGYLGVDIFFVLSGFLISKVTSEKYTSFKSYFIQRFLRIFPSLLIFSIIILLIFKSLYLNLDLQHQLITNFIYTISFLSNFLFSNLHYGDLDNFFNPFLHSWSLSIEFQFYIFFGLIFYFLNKRLFYIFFIITFFYYILEYNHSLYYNFSIRIWEFLSGFFVYELKKKNFQIKFKNIIVYISGILLLLSIFFGFRIGTVLFTSLILYFANIAKNKYLIPFYFLGNISYSIYLYHFGVISIFLFFNSKVNSYQVIFLIIVITILVSYLNYTFVEKYFIKKKLIKSSILFIILFSGIIIYKLDLPSFKYEKSILLKVVSEKRSAISLTIGKKECHNNICIDDKGFNQNIFVLGDSHAGLFIKKIYDFSVNKKFNFYSATHGNYPFFPNTFIYDNKKKEFDKKGKVLDLKIQNLIDSKKNEKNIIIIAGNYSRYLNESKIFSYNNVPSHDGFSKIYVADKSEIYSDKINLKLRKEKLSKVFLDYISSISNKNTHIILIYQIPEMDVDIPLYIRKNLFFSKPTDYFIPASIFSKRSEAAFKMFDGIVGDNIHRIFPSKITCNTFLDNKCVGSYMNELYYYDDDHASKYFQDLILNDLLNEIDKIR
jgi:peptidoglycan/LPS O-acetylase OafA/YrhL